MASKTIPNIQNTQQSNQILMMEDLSKTIMFTTNAMPGTPATIQYQANPDGTLKPKIEGQKSGQQGQEYPTFCYTTNVNKIQMITPTAQVKKI